MNTRLVKISLALCAAATVGGCTGVLAHKGAVVDPQLAASIQPGIDNKTSVEKLLGRPLAGIYAALDTSNTAGWDKFQKMYADIQALFLQLVSQAAGLVDKEARMTLAMSPDSAVALTATNSFGVNVEDLLKKNFPNMKVETAVQYGVTSTSNPNGVVAGNEVQLIVHNIEGQDTGYCAFNEKLRSHPIIREASSWKKKMTAGSWGAVIRMPVAFAQMVGV